MVVSWKKLLSNTNQARSRRKFLMMVVTGEEEKKKRRAADGVWRYYWQLKGLHGGIRRGGGRRGRQWL